MANRLLVLDHGKVVQFDHPREIYRRPVNPRVAALGGVANLVTPAQLGMEGNGQVMLRPENIRFTDSGEPWEVISSGFGGRHTEYVIRKNTTELIVHSAAQLRAGSFTAITIDPSDLHPL